MARVFITGVAGFLGSHLADAMIADGHTVVGVDNLLGGERSNVPKRVAFHVADCTNFGDMLTLTQGCDIVYHCAATAYEGLSVFSPAVVSHNIMGASTTVFSAAIANKVKRIVHCSSMARYGTGYPPFQENAAPAPQDPYGIAKVAAENMLRNLCTVHGVEFVIAVPHNIIGPRQKYDDPYRNVASIMMNLMLQGRTPVVYGDGTQQRCFSYIADCLFCLKAMAFADNVRGEVINIGPDEQPVTILELYDAIAKATAFRYPPTFMPGRPQEVKIALCSSDKVRRLLGYQTKTTLDQGIAKMVEWMRIRGTKPFQYHLPIEIMNEKTPQTWTKRLF